MRLSAQDVLALKLYFFRYLQKCFHVVNSLIHVSWMLIDFPTSWFDGSISIFFITIFKVIFSTAQHGKIRIFSFSRLKRRKSKLSQRMETNCRKEIAHNWSRELHLFKTSYCYISLHDSNTNIQERQKKYTFNNSCLR